MYFADCFLFMGKNIEQQIPRQGELFPGLLKASTKRFDDIDFVKPNGKPKGWEPRAKREARSAAMMPISRDTTTGKINDNGESGQKPEDNTSVKKYNDRYNNNVELSDIALRRANPDKWWLYID